MNYHIIFGLEEILEAYKVNEKMKSYLTEADSPFVFGVGGSITVFGDADNNGSILYIRNIWSSEKRKGYGRKFIDYLFEHTIIKEIEGEATPESVPFWFGMGAKFPQSIFQNFIEDDCFDDLLPFKLLSNKPSL